MRLSVLLYAGLLLLLITPIVWWRAPSPARRPRAAATTLVIGSVMFVAALWWPAEEERVANPRSHLDAAMPAWQFNEKHSIHVNAQPQKVFDSIRPVTAGEIRFFRALIAIRRLGRPTPPGILNAPENEPLLDLATRTSFHYVANDPPRELVVETVVVRPHAAIATMNFAVTPEGDGSRLTTETRVYANTDRARRRFAIYWRVIHPGSDIIRRSWLRAIKRRAESA